MILQWQMTLPSLFSLLLFHLFLQICLIFYVKSLRWFYITKWGKKGWKSKGRFWDDGYKHLWLLVIQDMVVVDEIDIIAVHVGYILTHIDT